MLIKIKINHILSSFYTNFGPTMAWKMELVVICSTTALWIAFYSRMVPLEEATRRRSSGPPPNLLIRTSLRRSKIFHTDTPPPSPFGDTKSPRTVLSAANLCHHVIWIPSYFFHRIEVLSDWKLRLY